MLTKRIAASGNEIDAYGDIRCSSRRVVGIAVERPLKGVAAERGAVLRSLLPA